MLKLFYYPVNISHLNQHTVDLLNAVSHFQNTLTEIGFTVQRQRMELANKGFSWRDLHSHQEQIKVSPQQYLELEEHILHIASILNLQTIDYGQKLILGDFEDTIVDVLIHSIGDNHRLSTDQELRKMNIVWETYIICPVINHLDSICRMDILNNKPLIGNAQVMDTWVKFEGDPENERGMFHTIGSLLSKGFFKALVPACETKYLPSSFVGNLVAWGLHASDNEDRNDIYMLLSLIHGLPYYKPSSGVIEKILSYEPGVVKRPTIDIIIDHCISLKSDLRDIDIPDDIGWQTSLLTLAKHVVTAQYV